MAAAIRGLNSGKAAGEDEIRPEMLKALNGGVRWLTRVCRVDGQCDFRPGRSTTNQIFTLRQIFEKSWEHAKDVFACFIDLGKAYNRVPRDKLWKVLQE